MTASQEIQGDARDIPGVLERMEAIDRATPAADGVSHFNRLYWRVTEEVGQQVEGTSFENDAFLTELDVLFANLYFDAYAQHARGERVAKAWRPLFEMREKPDTPPIQFALAGMNAHINHDLPVAVVSTCQELELHPEQETPHYRDYDRVNELLAHVQEHIKEWFAVGLIAEIDDACGKVDDALAIWSIAKSRRLAWEHAEILWELRDNPKLQAAYERTLGRMVGFAGRGILL
jgi:hypothetical protein